MCEIFARALILCIFLPKNVNQVKEVKTPEVKFINLAFIGYEIVQKLLNRIQITNFKLITIFKINYQSLLLQRSQSSIHVSNIFWYIYTDIYDWRKHTPLKVYHL